jgi:hypothetical protein
MAATSQISQIYKVNAPFMAVHPGAAGAFEPVMLIQGTIIGVEAGHTVFRFGLVSVVYEGETLAAFLRNIEDRAEPVDALSR